MNTHPAPGPSRVTAHSMHARLAALPPQQAQLDAALDAQDWDGARALAESIHYALGEALGARPSAEDMQGLRALLQDALGHVQHCLARVAQPHREASIAVRNAARARAARSAYGE